MAKEAVLMENEVIKLRGLKISRGDRFLASDDLGRNFSYQYLGIQEDGCGYDIYLHNETSGMFINVELEWFNQRKIFIL